MMEQFDEIMNTIVVFEENLKVMSDTQRNEMKAYYDGRGVPFRLRYERIEDESVIVFKMSQDHEKQARYFLGWEYEDEHLMFKFEDYQNNEVVLIYGETSERINDFMERLEELEDED